MTTQFFALERMDEQVVINLVRQSRLKPEPAVRKAQQQASLHPPNSENPRTGSNDTLQVGVQAGLKTRVLVKRLC